MGLVPGGGSRRQAQEGQGVGRTQHDRTARAGLEDLAIEDHARTVAFDPYLIAAADMDAVHDPAAEAPEQARDQGADQRGGILIDRHQLERTGRGVARDAGSDQQFLLWGEVRDKGSFLFGAYVHGIPAISLPAREDR